MPWMVLKAPEILSLSLTILIPAGTISTSNNSQFPIKERAARKWISDPLCGML